VARDSGRDGHIGEETTRCRRDVPGTHCRADQTYQGQQAAVHEEGGLTG